MDTRTENALGQTARDIEETGREVARETTNRISAAWQQARDTVQEKTRASVEATDRTVREHPYASLGVAFFSGLLLGVLLTRGRY